MFEIFGLLFKETISPGDLIRQTNVDVFVKQENTWFVFFY